MEILLILSVLLPLLLILYILQKHINGGNQYPLPPGPLGLPVIGHFNKLNSSREPHRYLWQLSKTYGPIMSLKLGCIQTLVASSARMAKEVMKVHDLEFASRPALTGQQKLSYNGLNMAFAPYNEYWREMRKIFVLHLFSTRRVQSFRAIREDEVHTMIEKFVKCEGEVVNLSESFMGLTSSIICRVAFGKRYEEKGNLRSRFRRVLNEAQAMEGAFFLSDFFPVVGRWVDKLSGLSKRLEKNFRELDDFYQEIIDDHLDPKREKVSEQEDITDVLLEMKREGLFTTWDHIKAVLMDVFVGGTDTGAATLVWALTALVKNTKVMRRVQEEVRNVVKKKGDNTYNNIIDEDDLQNLPYLKAVVKETLRLYPVAPLLIPRETIEECIIDGYRIPSKSLVFVNAWAVGRDPEAWDNPEEFLPERFVGNSIDFKGQHFELVPFGAGRRGCPGIYMGTLTVELALANMVSSFDWELPDGVNKEDIDTAVTPGIVMHKKNALCLVPKSYVWS